MKKYLSLILLILLAVLVFDRFIVQIVWVNPNVNTKVFPYISKTLKDIDKALNYTVSIMKSNKLDVKILYKNAYGSGFLKHNPIPNDLDYSIGIYLGEYDFDGQNSLEIAREIDRKMSLFQAEFYNYINTIDPEKFYSDYSVISSLTESSYKSDANIKAITSSIPNLFNHKNYIIYTDKILLDKNKKAVHMTFPFILKENEILIEDFSPVTVYTELVKYNKNTRGMMREITIVTDFYADIKKGDDLVNAEIVAESFTGQRLQLTRRFFVPVIFAGNCSAKYLKHLNLLTDDDAYIEYRLFNFKRHLQEFSNLNELEMRPVKLFKRVLQCEDLILPLLAPETVEEINNTIEANLNNPKIQLINDWQTAFENLTKITAMPRLYLKAQYKNKITRHLDSMKQITLEMKNSGLFNKDDIALIENFTDDIAERQKLINSESKLDEYHKYILKNSDPVIDAAIRITTEATRDKEKIIGYIDTFGKILEAAGFRKIDMCWLDKNLIGIVKDDFTSTIEEKDLKLMAKENGLADVEYKFINKSSLSGTKVRYALWVRYNPTDKENQIYENMKSELLKDKTNFNIKRRFILQILSGIQTH